MICKKSYILIQGNMYIEELILISLYFHFRNITKLSKEQKYLTESAKAIIQLNKRLQTFGLCFHAIHQKDRAELKNLQHRLTVLMMNESIQTANNNKLHPELDNLCFKVHTGLVK